MEKLVKEDGSHNAQGHDDRELLMGARSDGERRAPMKPAGATPIALIKRADTEVPAKAVKRQYSAEYKRRILEEADSCKGIPGALGALLRGEGLYTSNLRTWRRQREQALIKGLSPKKRGRREKAVNPLSRRVIELEAENRKLKAQLEKAETIIAFQKKLSEMLGISAGAQRC